MPGAHPGPQHRSTHQPTARDAEKKAAHARSTKPSVQGARGGALGGATTADDGYIRAADLLDIDPGATVATSAVPTSAPLTPAQPQPSWLGSAPDTGAHASSNGPAPAAALSARAERHTSIPVYHPESDELPGDLYATDEEDVVEDYDDDYVDASADDDDWLVIDQPTANLRREAFAAARDSLADSMPASESDSMHDAVPDFVPDSVPGVLSGGYAPAPGQPLRPDVLGGPRYASPDGDLMPMTPLTGIPRSALVNPRMERFQELREQRKAHERGERAPQDSPQVNERVRTWWMDLTPGLQRALKLQHEARESGAHAVPGYVVTVASAVLRMTDAFGKLAVSTREFANRAHATAGPTLKRMHDSAEAYAQALIDKLDGTPVQQQASFLGPGRLAVLFKSGVTVGQAQRVLQSVNARPLRLIPRKHGFLALVARGMEAIVAERLKQHPFVRDVIYMEYDDPSQSLSTEVPAIMGMRRM